MKNRIALVTGASSGIGQATAERLARDGYKVHGSAPLPVLDFEAGDRA